jgi:N-acetylmuramoyl-L-alanine amidase
MGLLASCAKRPYAATDKIYRRQAKEFSKTLLQTGVPTLADSAGVAIPASFVGTVNFNLRKPNYVVIHYTAQKSAAQTLTTFTQTSTQVSAHYVVGRNGQVYHMLNDYMRAWHAGVSKWGSVTDMNSCSIGIEVDNDGDEPFSAVQINSLLALLKQLKKAYNIPAANFIGHQDVAPLRKFDPGILFPWKTLAQNGIGTWSDDVLDLAPDNFDYILALRLIGYDTTDLPSAIVAFKAHFVQTDKKPELSQLDLNVLFNIYQKLL